MNNYEIRRVQAIGSGKSFMVVLPKTYTKILDINKGDWVKLTTDKKRIYVEKASS